MRAGPWGICLLGHSACGSLHGTVLPAWNPARAGPALPAAQLWWQKGPGIGTHPLAAPLEASAADSSVLCLRALGGVR